ncbi:MAG: bifunctional UDP-2,4-diacetamido-2,4,6-trideoxy-beta-L-altropyranose hydrolase/GNAT family N-acetyltransferase [Gemmatimonadota bacterium]|nr:bifunctional UDP-2,4-diacetamido-2,4,6-trideoxy-beta-L-altropyranose hydrolase/GNAT family N-acetyltransferase [Gemmatimonadota bacterium]
MPDAAAGLTMELDADANPVIGAGHLMRCAALAEAWLDLGLGAVRFAGALDLPFTASRASLLVARAPERTGASTVLVSDSYDQPRRERAARRDDVRARILVDDLCRPVPEGFDAVWNPSPRASQLDYPRFRGAVLAGPDVLPIRTGLPHWCGAPGPTAVLLGGGRPLPHVSAALDLLATRHDPGAFARLGDWMPRVWAALDPHRPWDGIARCGRLLTGAGATLWEAATVQVPVAVMLLAENQRRGFEWAVNAGAPGIDALAITSVNTLAEQFAAALPAAVPLPPMRAGTERVARWIGALAGSRAHPSSGLRLRPGLAADAYPLWLWANDTVTRAASFGRPPIEWQKHREWLGAQLADPAVLLLLAEATDHCPIGVLRLQTSDHWVTARLSYGLALEARGRGLGHALVTAGLDALRAFHPLARVEAEVATGNAPSLKIFRRLGWSEQRSADRIVFDSGRDE